MCPPGYWDMNVPEMIAQVEAGRNPSLVTLKRLSTVLDVPIAYLGGFEASWLTIVPWVVFKFFGSNENILFLLLSNNNCFNTECLSSPLLPN